MKVEIRTAAVADAQAACRVLRRSIEECCVADHHNDQELLSMWLSNKTAENISRLFADSGNIAVVATSGKEIVGVGLITTEGILALCYVLPEVRFRGVGKSLLNELQSRVRLIGLKEICLSSTVTAREFYLRNGFTASGAPETAFGVSAYPLLKK